VAILIKKKGRKIDMLDPIFLEAAEDFNLK